MIEKKNKIKEKKIKKIERKRRRGKETGYKQRKHK